jgi:hypothetical protein
MAAASKIQAIARSSAPSGEKLVGAANAMADLLERLGYSDVSAEYDKLREGVIQQQQRSPMVREPSTKEIQ